MATWRRSIRHRLSAAALTLALAPGAVVAQVGATAPATPVQPQSAGPISPQPPAASNGAPTSDAALSTPPAKTSSEAEARPQAAPRPLRPPADPTAAAVYAVLEKHCARCHQGGRLDRPAPAAAFGNILRLDEIAAAPHLIQPGNPDGSRLYVSMLRRLMPPEASSPDGEAPHGAPTADEIALVRSWISSLPPRQTCRDRRFVTPADHAATLSELAGVTTEDPKKLRFLSIAHLHNGCVRFEALAAYRQAMVRLFNSLSWKVAPVAVPPIDPARTLFKINLDDLGWLPEHWERIMRSGTSPLGLVAPLPVDVRRLFGTESPVARADWFAQTVLSAPLYYEVLGLPGTGPEILKILQAAPTGNAGPTHPLRTLVSPSAFAQQPSLLERLQSRAGPFWQAFHWLAGEGAPEASQDASLASLERAPPYHASRGMFTLPNGLPGFFVVGQRGDRLDALPPGIARTTAAGSGDLKGGLDCMECHRTGPIARKPAPSASQPVDLALAADGAAIAEAMRRIGIDPELTLDGVDPVVALAREYARPLDVGRAAAELGIEPEALRSLADRGGESASHVLARRLVQGLVARGEVEARARELASASGRQADTPESAAGQDLSRRFAPVDPGPGLVLYSDKVRYKKGDSLHLYVRVGADCHLTLVSVDTRGRGTVIFPSDFETNALLAAGQELKLPGPAAPYTFRLNESGRETVVALCNEAGALTDNIRHDFERQRFTDLGDYGAFLAQNALAEPGKAENAPARRVGQRGRRRGEADASGPRARPEQISRTAISIEVE
ncbi:MAG: DUF4384 domain-containing protein [Hyphomicrobiaceae bacterium]